LPRSPYTRLHAVASQLATAEAERNPGYPRYGGLFSPAAVSQLRTPSLTKAGADGMVDAISRTGYRGPGSYKPHPKEMPR
jgi:hypothetical protein